jgi:uncharacterized membrane protein YuzA (DUF378 family)
MEPPLRTESPETVSVLIQIFGALIWAGVGLVLVWQYNPHGREMRTVLLIFGAAAAVCVGLISIYLLFPRRRGPYARHLLGSALGGLTAISLVVPVFVPLVRIQMELTPRIMNALHFDLVEKWHGIMDPYGACIEIVLIGMAAGWLVVAFRSRPETKRLRSDVP